MIRKLLLYFLTFSILFSSIFSAYTLATSCPTGYTYEQCINYLNQISSKLKKESSNLNSQISNEQYNQLSLQEKINYIEGQIKKSENEIKQLEVDIETKGVEARILDRDIQELQTNIDTISQEVDKLDSAIQKRVSLTYRYSFITPLEIFLESSNFDSLLRRFKYLVETRKKDKVLLEELSDKSNVLKEEEKVLGDKRVELEKKRVEIEDTKSDMFAQKVNLQTQQNQKSVLLAESERKEAELRKKLDQNRLAQARLDRAIIEYIIKNSGKAIYGGSVTRGQAIGTMGNTGLSYGAHLHYSISSTKQIGYGNINPANGYLKIGPDYWAKSGTWKYYYVRSNAYLLPLAGTVILTQDAHQGQAIDMVSLLGEGALVLASKEGKVYSGTDQYGGKYVWIDHPDGKRTTYLHLKSVYVKKI